MVLDEEERQGWTKETLVSLLYFQAAFIKRKLFNTTNEWKRGIKENSCVKESMP